MLDLLPDLSGQPPWVTLLVVLLFVTGTLGGAWIRRGTPNAELEERDDGARPRGEAGQQPSLSGPDLHTAQVLKQALDLLASEASESSAARTENSELRAQLLACDAERNRLTRELGVAHSELAACTAECHRLARKALGQEGDEDV